MKGKIMRTNITVDNDTIRRLHDIADALAANEITIDKKVITLVEPIKQVGEYTAQDTSWWISLRRGQNHLI